MQGMWGGILISETLSRKSFFCKAEAVAESVRLWLFSIAANCLFWAGLFHALWRFRCASFGSWASGLKEVHHTRIMRPLKNSHQPLPWWNWGSWTTKYWTEAHWNSPWNPALVWGKSQHWVTRELPAPEWPWIDALGPDSCTPSPQVQVWSGQAPTQAPCPQIIVVDTGQDQLSWFTWFSQQLHSLVQHPLDPAGPPPPLFHSVCQVYPVEIHNQSVSMAHGLNDFWETWRIWVMFL